MVETVISYDFDQFQYWGTHEGVARGLPTKIYERGAKAPLEIFWALRHSVNRVETKTVSADLAPGTALNVTLIGNYTSMEAPYSATLVAYYQETDGSVSRKILSTVSLL